MSMTSAKIGLMDLNLILFFMIGTYIKDAFIIFLSPYRVLRNDNLSVVASGNCCLSLVLGCLTLSKELARSHVGTFYYQFGEALVQRLPHGKLRLTLLKLWAFSAMSSQVAFNAIFMQVFHPVVLFVVYIPVICVNLVQGPPDNSVWNRIKATIFEPGKLVAHFGTSVFGLGQWDPFTNQEQGNQPALHYTMVQILRTLVMMVLMCFDFPAAPIRPMGVGVFYHELLVPGQTFIGDSVECFRDMKHGVQSTLRTHNFTKSQLAFCCQVSGRDAYKTFLQLIVVLGLPVYTAGMMVLLGSFAYRTGKPDEELNASLRSMFIDVVQLMPQGSDDDDLKELEQV